MGHVLNYTLGDVVSHVRRRNGYSVLRPMGYDAFGLPAENAAIREGGHPREVTERNIAAIREQIRRMGWSIDWTREVSTHEPEYYRWTQWLFLKLFEQGLAYRKAAPVKWCPNDQTVLANEQVIDGRCERCGCGGRVAEPRAVDVQDHRLLRPPARRHGRAGLARARADDAAQLDRPLGGRRGHVPGRGARRGRRRSSRPGRTRSSARRSSCSRPSTRSSSGSPIARPTARRSATYARHAAAKKSEERAAGEEKTGVFTGFYAVNPVNDARIPIWVADYVLMDYGTGAIMAVPAHDERDFAFAREVRPADRAGRRARRTARSRRAPPTSRIPTNEVLVNSGPVHGALVAGGEEGDRRRARGARPRPRRRQLPAARLAALAAAVLGLPDPDDPLRRLRDRAGARGRSAGAPARGRRLPAEGPLAARRRRGLGERHLPVVRRPGEARDRHDGHVRRLVLVLPALHDARTTRPGRSSATSSTTGCRSTSTSAGSSTRSCT